MNQDIYVIAEHVRGEVAPITHELIGRAKALTGEHGGDVYVVVAGSTGQAVDAFPGADAVLTVTNDYLSDFTPATWQAAMYHVLETRRPRLVLAGSTSIGFDLAAALSETLGVPMACGCRDIMFDGNSTRCTSQLYGGKILVESRTTAETVIAQVMPGSHPPADVPAGEVRHERITLGADGTEFASRFVSYVLPDAGDIDITQYPVLVSVGRGIQSRENIALAEELATAIGGAVSSSRPVVDQDWLPITRQVGKSGMTVKPKLYLALGISGAPEHLEGMKDAELIVAVNSDPKAPIFSVAHYGIEADILDFIPEFTDRLKEAVS